MAHVTVLGAGSYGTAFATLLAANGHSVRLWCYESELALCIGQNSVNQWYLPDIILDKNIQATSDIKHALDGSSWVFEAIPVKHLRAVVSSALPYLTPTQKLVLLSKGIEQESLLLPTQIMQDLGIDSELISVVSGPNYAKDLGHGALSATVVASYHHLVQQELSALIKSNYMLPIASNDVIGIQLAGALKNVITIGIGIARGAGYAENTVAALLTWGLSEIGQVIHAYQGETQTIYGLAGCGDLFLTALGSQSRNGRLGMLLGQGKSIEDAIQIIGVEPEGVNTVVSMRHMILLKKLQLPLCIGISDILQGARSPQEVFSELWRC